MTIFYRQRLWDTGTVGYVYYEKTIIDPAPLAAETSPNYTGAISAHSIIEVRDDGAATGLQNNLVGTAAPTVTDDSAAGYAAGSLWAVTVGAADGLGVWIAKSVGVGAADWRKIDVKHNITAAGAPAVTDDSTAGYSVGSLWLWPGNGMWICLGASVGAALWAAPLFSVNSADVAAAGAVMDSDFAGGSLGFMARTGTGPYTYAVARNEPGPTGGVPGALDDSSAGYAYGSTYVFGTDVYMCIDASVGAAVWKWISSTGAAASAVTPLVAAAVGAVGVAAPYSREDHVHPAEQVFGDLSAPVTGAFNFSTYARLDIVLVSTVAGVATGTLPGPTRGARCRVKDIGGNLSVNALTIARAAAEKIEGVAANYIFAADYGALDLVCDGTDWWVL